MVDANIKKVTILNNQLPLISTDSDGLFYDTRYRIVSEDKNRLSHWSPIKRIDMPPTTDADLPYTTTPRITVYSVNTGTGGKAISASWIFPQTDAELNPDPYKAELERRFRQVTFFDIFIRWSPNNTGSTWDPWKYETTISSNSYSIIRQETPYQAKRIEIVVQIPKNIKEIDSRLELFRTIHTV
jgi:hypothetical protein